MKVVADWDRRSVHVRLSKRNLLALLAKVDDEISGKTLVRQGDPTNIDGEPHLVVEAEPDEVHYGDRAYGPGRMHPIAEEFISTYQNATFRPGDNPADS